MRLRCSLGYALIVLPLFAWQPSIAAAQVQIDGLREAVDFYHEHATSDLQHIHEATHRFEAIAIAYPVGEDREGAWLPAYWTSFVYTQLALFAKDDRQQPFVTLAEYYYEKALSEKPDSGPEVDADFFALKAMVLNFKATADPENAEAHKAAAQGYWARARDADPSNPMVRMNSGIALLRDPETRAQAYEILDLAIESYNLRMDSVQPNWGREFIDAWTGSFPRPGQESAKDDETGSSGPR